ncbi:hypothetical protein CSKR_200804 [Clonorchis sinensis]|uniref:Uncharacterized protein n=1 Tax=Clonorchis sinensis TaxID=79923 RepID=A0A8T1MII6_CLOSI|nr:hypothetical protein CSKR_200804 [Clonorchis sinensis]
MNDPNILARNQPTEILEFMLVQLVWNKTHFILQLNMQSTAAPISLLCRILLITFMGGVICLPAGEEEAYERLLSGTQDYMYPELNNERINPLSGHSLLRGFRYPYGDQQNPLYNVQRRRFTRPVGR